MADCHPDTYISVDNLLFALLYFIKLVGSEIKTASLSVHTVFYRTWL